jgi:hypothetical protein
MLRARSYGFVSPRRKVTSPFSSVGSFFRAPVLHGVFAIREFHALPLRALLGLSFTAEGGAVAFSTAEDY